MAKDRLRKKKSKKGRGLKNKYNGRLSIVIPCYNESDRVRPLFEAMKSFDERWKIPYELIVVDDGSKDESVSKIKSAFPGDCKNLDHFEMIEFKENAGKGSALKSGVAAASGDHILTIDADMSSIPSELLNWVNRLPGNTFPENEILIASREHADSKVEGPASRKFVGWVFNFIIQLFTSLNLKDTQCGFKLYPASIAKRLFSNLKIGGWAHDVELLYKADLEGIRINSLPVTWKHVEGTKIRVARDSFRMFMQTLMISFLAKWEWFVAGPLKSFRSKSKVGKESPLFRFAFVLLAAILLVLMPSVSDDYAITGDEFVQRVYGDKLLKHYKSGGENTSYLDWKNLKYYGGLFDFMASALNPADNPNPPDPEQADREEKEFQNPVRARGDVYEFRHFLNSLTGFLLILFGGLLATRITGSWMIGFLTMLFLALSPRIFGHSMNNPKDIPFAAAYTFTLYHMIRFLRELPRPGIKSCLWTVVGIALAINIRVGGILLIAYLGLFSAIVFLWQPELRALLLKPLKILKPIVTVVVMAVLGYFGGMLFWPYAQIDPINNPIEALGQMTDFSTGIRMLFAGEHIWSDRVPWHYLPTWFGVGAPLFMVLGLLASPILLILFRKDIKGLPFFLVGFAGFFPLIYAIANKSPLYDGMRHFIFIYPILALFAAWAWAQGIHHLRPKAVRAGTAIILVVLLALPARWMVVNHPYQYIYFNELNGGVDNAFARYETDYWMNSMKGLSDWFLENVPEANAAYEAKKQGATLDEIREMPRVVIGTNCHQPVFHYLGKKYPNIVVHYVRYHDREQFHWDYGFFFSRFINKKFLESGAWPPGEIVYEEKVENTVIGAVVKGGEPFANEAHKAMKAKDFLKADSLYRLEAGQHPKSEAAYLGIANANMQLRRFAEAREGIDKALELADENVTTLGMLGSWYIQTGDKENARVTFSKAAELNYKFTNSYFYLANMALQEGNLEEAAKNIELFDIHGGRIPQVFDWGIDLWTQKNNIARADYYRAKKAYFQGQGQQALEHLTKSLRADKNYKPAKELMAAFEKMMANQK
ncbi:MAG: glycosyltransferase [Bacteroidota bacterium]